MPICFECRETGLPHDEHMSHAELEEWQRGRQLWDAEIERVREVNRLWVEALTARDDG